MANRIAGITVTINGDTTGLSKALESVNKTIKNTQSQLKDKKSSLSRIRIFANAKISDIMTRQSEMESSYDYICPVMADTESEGNE